MYKRPDTTRKTQITFGPHSDLQPSLSRDGSTIYFASDQDPNGVFNIYAMELATGTVRQYTDVVGGCFSPVEMASRGDEPSLVFVAYYAGSFRLYRMPLLESEREISIEERLAVPIEAETFEAPMELTVDEDKKRPYKLLWDIESPSIAVGVTNDGTILSNGAVTISDLLGDHRFNVYASTVSSYTNLVAEYLNVKRRWNWGSRFFDSRDYFVTVRGTDQVQRSTGINAFFQYPISRHYRFEATAGYLDLTQDFITGYDEIGFPSFTTVSEKYATTSVGLVGDTTRFQGFGPFQGKRFNVTANYGKSLGSTLAGDLLDYRLDFRTYAQATRRSTLAWRVFGVLNGGDRQTFYSVGGNNTLRGYEFREFFGSNVVFSNLEFRFPLVNSLDTAIGALGPVRGFLFLDVAAAWLQDDEWYDPNLGTIRGEVSGQDLPFSAWDSDNNRLQDARATYGFGIQFFFAGLQLNWAWANRLPYTEYVREDPLDFFSQLVPVENSGGDSRMDFYIVYDF